MDTSLGHVDPPDTTPSRDIRTLLQAAAGITRHDIDAVTLSHGHPDHVAGSVLRADDGEFVPMFPNAVHYMQRAEYDYASDSMREAWKFDTYLGAVEDAGLLRVIDGKHYAPTIRCRLGVGCLFVGIHCGGSSSWSATGWGERATVLALAAALSWMVATALARRGAG